MNPYLFLTRQAGFEDVGDLVEELGAWHDSMVLHQRLVGRFGAEACSDSCAHVIGRDLWAQARQRLGPAADSLTFLRKSANFRVPG